MARIRRCKITTTGSAGSATGEAYISVPNATVLLAVDIDYHASAPATTDILIKINNSSGRQLFSRPNSATDLVWTPLGKASIDDSAAAVTSFVGPIVIDADVLHVSVAGCDALTDAVVLKVLVD